MASFNKFNNFVQKIADGTGINFTSDSLKVMLTNTAPVATNSVFTDLVDLASGNGYSAGGTVMASTGWSNASGTSSLAGSNVVFTASGGSIGPFRYAVLYDSTPATKPLVGWWDYGSAVTLTVGNTFTVAPVSTAAIITLA